MKGLGRAGTIGNHYFSQPLAMLRNTCKIVDKSVAVIGLVRVANGVAYNGPKLQWLRMKNSNDGHMTDQTFPKDETSSWARLVNRGPSCEVAATAVG
jgi:hypothetical protein